MTSGRNLMKDNLSFKSAKDYQQYKKMQEDDYTESLESWFDRRYKIPEVIPDMYQRLVETLKVDINNFLYDKVHSDMTIGQFQRLTVAIHELIIHEYQKHMNNTPHKNDYAQWKISEQNWRDFKTGDMK